MLYAREINQAEDICNQAQLHTPPAHGTGLELDGNGFAAWLPPFHCCCMGQWSELTWPTYTQVSTARTLYSMGGAYQDAAATVVMNILQRLPDHWEALYLYAGIAADRRMIADAVKVLLRLLVHDPEHAGVR